MQNCTIPAGKAILVPLLTGECGYEVPEVKNDADMRTCASAGNEYGVIEATVDGVKMKNLDTCMASRYFNSSIVANNIYDSPAGRYRAFADGFFVYCICCIWSSEKNI